MDGSFKEKHYLQVNQGRLHEELTVDSDSEEYRISRCECSEKGQSLYMNKANSAQRTWKAAGRGQACLKENRRTTFGK